MGDTVDHYDWFGHNGDAFGSNARAYRKDDGSAAFASVFNTCNYGALHGMGFQILNDDMNDDMNYTGDNVTPVETDTPTASGSIGSEAMPTGSPTVPSLESPSSGSFKATAIWLSVFVVGYFS